MSFYQKIATVGIKYFGKSKSFKYGFNLSPMYRRTTAKITYVSEDLLKVSIQIKLSYKNKNYVNSIFGGSLFSATDPISMVQLINLIGSKYVVWDKSSEIFFKQPAKETVYADFEFTQNELEQIKSRVETEKEINIEKTILLTSEDKNKVFCKVKKVIYVSTKDFYKQKLAMRNSSKNN